MAEHHRDRPLSGETASITLGRQEWYTGSVYSRWSLVENAVFRYKSILGQRMRSRSLGSQRIEVQLACKILNTMTSLGRPESYRVT